MAIERMSIEEIRRRKGRTDWDRLERQGDHKEPAEFDADYDAATLVDPEKKEPK